MPKELRSFIETVKIDAKLQSPHFQPETLAHYLKGIVAAHESLTVATPALTIGLAAYGVCKHSQRA